MIDELNVLAMDLAKAGPLAAVGIVPVVKRGGHNVMTRWRDLAGGLAHAPAYPASITYDTTVEGTVIEVVVGPDKDRPQGALGNLIEYGSPHSAPHNHGGQALDEEASRFEEQIAGVAARFL